MLLERIKRDGHIEDFWANIQAPANTWQQLFLNIILAMLYFLQYLLIVTPRNILHDRLIHRNRRIDSYSEYEFQELYGMNQWHAAAVMACCCCNDSMGYI